MRSYIRFVAALTVIGVCAAVGISLPRTSNAQGQVLSVPAVEVPAAMVGDPTPLASR